MNKYRPCKVIKFDKNQNIRNSIISREHPKKDINVSILINDTGESWAILNNVPETHFPSINLSFFDPPLNIGSEEEYRNHYEPGKYYSPGSVIIHEFCHILGMQHEHVSPHVKHWDLNKEEILKYYKDEEEMKTQVLDICSHKENFIGPFDVNSVMLYYFPDEWFLRHGEPGFVNPTKVNFTLSSSDKKCLLKYYPKSKNINVNVSMHFKTRQLYKKKWIFYWIKNILVNEFSFLGLSFYFKDPELLRGHRRREVNKPK